jgi:hypothetical protein
MKGKVFMCLFALPFLGVGLWMGSSMFGHAYDAWLMRGWTPVQATVHRGGYETRSGDDADTYEAYADYAYVWNERQYYGNRVSISGGADNIGDYQQALGRQLSNASSRGAPITAWIDPADPSSSVVDRNLRWGLIGFKAIFFLVFGGVGAGLLYLVFRRRSRTDLTESVAADKPWLAREAWQTATIRSGSRATMWFAWGFAAFWNAISAPLPFVIYPEVVEKGNLLALIGLVFPVVGAGLITWAVARTLEWRRFGRAPVTLDPFPGAIGGHVGGTIDVNMPYGPSSRYSLTLTSLRSYVSGSGDNRSRRERPAWQDSQVAHASPGPNGTTLTFRFDVPEGLTASDALQDGDDYHLWRLNLKAELPGANIDRDYEIPVYATGAWSQQLSAYSVDEARAEQRDIDLARIRDSIRLERGFSGKRMLFPAGRNLPGGLVGFVIGSVFAGTGWFLGVQQNHWFMGVIFGFVGILIAISAIYMLANSLEVLQDGESLRTVRRLFGIPVKRGEMRRHDFVRFDKTSSMSSQSGSKHVMYYSLHAVDASGGKLVVGEGFKGAGQADAAAEMIAREFGLAMAGKRRDADSAPGDFNVLTAD